VNLTKRVSLQIRLDASEQFKFETRTGPIMADYIMFNPKDFNKREGFEREAWVRGFAIKIDGSMALIHRADHIKFSDIPPHILEAAVKEFNRRELVRL
jgi:hypothetical protein